MFPRRHSTVSKRLVISTMIVAFVALACTQQRTPEDQQNPATSEEKERSGDGKRPEAEPVSAPVDVQPTDFGLVKRRMKLGDYLHRIGVLFDCYFTVEEFTGETSDMASVHNVVSVTCGPKLGSLDEVSAKLNKHLASVSYEEAMRPAL